MQHTTVSLTSFTDAPYLQTILEQPLEKKSGLIPSLVLNSGLEKQGCFTSFKKQLQSFFDCIKVVHTGSEVVCDGH